MRPLATLYEVSRKPGCQKADFSEKPGFSSAPFRCVLALFAACFGMAAAAATAAEQEPGISVVGSGGVSAKPSVAEFRVRVVGASELSGDAIIKFRDAKRRTLAAIEQLKIKNLHSDVDGVSVAVAGEPQHQMIDFSGDGQRPAVKPQIEFACGIRLSLRDIQDMPEEKLIEALSKVLDKLHDSGVEVQPAATDAVVAQIDDESEASPAQKIATFYVENLREMRETVYQQAFAAARSSAERLARLAGVKLGPVVSLQEFPAAASEEALAQMFTGGEAPTAEKDRSRIGSYKFAPIPIRVSLQVRFAIDK